MPPGDADLARLSNSTLRRICLFVPPVSLREVLVATFRQRSGGWQVRVRRQGYPDVVKTFKLRQDGEKWARAIERELDMGCYVSIAQQQSG